MKKFIALFVFCFSMLFALIPTFASAQDSESRFNGGYFAADFVAGIGRVDEKLFNGRDEDYDKKTYTFAWQFQLEGGYLWGDKVLVGPAVTVSAGIPSIVNGALQLKVALPFDDSNAIHFMAGVGGTFHLKYEDTIFDGNALNYFYIPIQIGYEHIFDNGFILGVIFHTDINFNHREIIDSYTNDGNRKAKLDNEAVLALMGLGIRAGYKF